MSSALIQRIWALVEPVAAEEGLEIVDIELLGEGRGTVLRLYLDQQGGGGSVDLDTLASVSREVSDAVDVHDIIPGRYTLEVSSPGINRRLRVAEQFRRYIGRRVRVRVTTPIEGRRSFLGTLRAVDAQGVTIAGEGREDFVPFGTIAQANYEHDFANDRGQRTGGARRRHAAGTQSGH